MSNIIIDFAHRSELDGIVSLWNGCFGDEPGAIARFFGSFEFEGHVAIAKYRGELAAHMSMVPLSLRCGGSVYTGAYIYAVCVAKQYRGMGILRLMLNWLDGYISENSLSFAMLIPADDILAATYRRYGFDIALGGIAPIGDNGRFGCSIDTERMDALSLSPFDHNYERLYTLMIDSGTDRFIKEPEFFRYTLDILAPTTEIKYINDKGGIPYGYIIYQPEIIKGKNLVNIFDICYPKAKIGDTINICNLSDFRPYPKALCKAAYLPAEFAGGVLSDLFAEF